jgi:hypothetical protein
MTRNELQLSDNAAAFTVEEELPEERSIAAADSATMAVGDGGADQDAVDLSVATEEEDEGDAFERQRQAEATVQFKRLKDDARAVYGMVRGLPGVRSPEKWAELLEKAGDDIGNGRFIVRCLGAERYLDYETVAVLLTLRQNLISERQRLTAADIMQIDAAIVAYFNMLRVQGWIGNLSLVVEGEAFGQAALNEYHGDRVGERLAEQLRRLAEVILPLQERAAKMMIRSLASLSAPSPRRLPSTRWKDRRP